FFYCFCYRPDFTSFPTRRSSDLEAAAGEECDTMDAFCDYDGLVCHCTNCREFPVQGCNGPPIWMCDAPNLDDECPTSWPRLGSRDRKSTRLNSSHVKISYAVFCL